MKENQDYNHEFSMTELICVNPFKNWDYCHVGIVKEVVHEDDTSSFYGEVDIDEYKFHCTSIEKELVVRKLEQIIILHYTINCPTNQESVNEKFYKGSSLN
jgi:hypothetical protein